jgi:U3 small nucleolar RNA-associated protein 6
MADKVQLSLEHTLNELDQLVKQGLFTKTEVRNIIKKRRFYEYKFEKKDVTKQDFFKAIRYEKILVKIILIKDKKRKQRKKEKKVKQTSFFEFTFLRRAVYLFQKLIRKFNNSQEIWMEFFYFLIKNQCYNVINREVGKCLSLFPQNLGIIYIIKNFGKSLHIMNMKITATP